MPTYNLPEETGINLSSGLDQIFVYIAGELPSFIPLVLASIFILIFISGYKAQERKEGRGSFVTWFSISSWIVSIIAVLMTLIQGLITIPTVSICLAISFLSMIFLYIGRE